MRSGPLALALAVTAAAGGAARAGTIEGRVFVDEDGDGLLSSGDRTLPGIQVAWETTIFVTTGADGFFELTAPAADGIIWARVPDGFRPGPVWAAVAADGGTADLAFVEADPDASASFVVASDLHIGKEKLLDPGESLDDDDLSHSLEQAAAQVQSPRFIALTGDLVQSNQPQHYAILRDVAASLSVPLVPVPGNHDWFDGGASYREAMGPPMYSFDSAGAHYVVLNDNASVTEWESFLAQDTGDLDEDVPLVGFIHRPPEPPELAALEASGIDYLFTGHWHGNMTHQFGGLLQLNTEPFVRGGVDGTPAGFRIVDVSAAGLQTQHRTVVDRPVVRLLQPAMNQCTPGDEMDVIAAVELGAEVDRVRVVLGEQVTALDPAGGWNWTAHVAIPDPRPDTVVIEAVHLDGTVTSTMQPFNDCACQLDTSPGDWTQTQGGPDHTGARGDAIAPPLRTLWVKALGGHPTAAPVVAGGLAYLPIADYDVGARGGVVALDLATGAEVWRFEPGADVRNAIAVEAGIAVVPASDGVLHAVDAATGALLWSHDLSDGVPPTTGILHAAPTIADGVVYAAVHRRAAALDLETGDVIWQADPAPDGTSLTSHAAAAVVDGVVIDTVARGRNGAFAWQASTGEELWRLLPPDSIGVQASPIVDGELVYFVNAAAQVIALDRRTGEVIWRTSLVDTAADWDYSVQATPALASGRLFVPTQYDDLVAVDASSGDVLWRCSAGESALHDAHSRSLSRSYPSSPVVTGDIVWITGGDGVLRALDAGSGHTLWTLDLGVPGNGGLAPAGDYLLVATYDGTVRALISDECGAPPPVPDDGGCGCDTGDGGGAALLVLLAIATGLAPLRRGARRGGRPIAP